MNRKFKKLLVFTTSILCTGTISADESNFDFNKVLKGHSDSTLEDFISRMTDVDYLNKVKSDPTKPKFYDKVSKKLLLNRGEKRIFKENKVVLVDHDQRDSLGSAYYGVYTRDLPVLITTDSIMHALHNSFNQNSTISL